MPETTTLLSMIRRKIAGARAFGDILQDKIIDVRR